MKRDRLHLCLALLVTGFLTCAFYLYLVQVRRGFWTPWVGMTFSAHKPPKDGSWMPFGISNRIGTVQSVIAGGPAFRQGVHVGDRVRAVDGIPIERVGEVVAHLQKLGPGAPVRFELETDGRPRTVTLTPEIALGWTQSILSQASSAVTALIFLLVGVFVIFRRLGDFRVLLLFIVCAMAATAFLYYPMIGLAFANTYGIQHESFFSPGMGLMLLLVVISGLLLSMTLLHLTLVFPRPLRQVEAHPRIIRWVYLLAPFGYLFATSAIFLFAYFSFLTSLGLGRVGLASAATAALAGFVFRRRLVPRGKGFRAFLADHPWRVTAFCLVALAAFCGFSAPLAAWGLVPEALIIAGGLCLFAGVILMPLLYPVASCVALYLQHRQSRADERAQLRWPIWGTFAAVSGNLLLGLVVIGSAIVGRTAPGVQLAGELGSKALYVLIPVSFAVGILRHQVLDITVLIRRTLIYALVTFSVLAVFFVLAGGAGGLLATYAGVRSTWSIVLSTLCAVAVITPVQRRVQGFVDRRFFRKRFEYPKQLEHLEKILQQSEERSDIFNQFIGKVETVSPFRSGAVFFRAEGETVFRAVQAFGTLEETYPCRRIEDSDPLVRRLDRNSGPGSPLLEEETTRKRPKGLHALAGFRVEERLTGFLAVPGEALPPNLEAEDLDFVRQAACLVSRALERQKLRAQSLDLERALEIQRNLLPRSVPEVPGGRFAVHWKPSRSVGGDLYDFFDFGGGRFGFTIADVSGKGMPAALIMSNLQAAFRAVIDQTCPPDEACRRLNRSAVNLLGDGRFVTYFYGIYDSKHQELGYCNAGHCAPLLLREDGASERLESGGPVLGVLPDAGFESGRVSLRAGDRIVLYTDGLSEAASVDGEEFGETRIGTVCRFAWDLDPESMIRALVEAIREHSAGELQDDLTVLVLALDNTGGKG